MKRVCARQLMFVSLVRYDGLNDIWNNPLWVLFVPVLVTPSPELIMLIRLQRFHAVSCQPSLKSVLSRGFRQCILESREAGMHKSCEQ